MKYFKNILVGGAMLGMLVAACDTDELHDLNINPNAVDKINLNFLFTSAELGAASGGSAGDNRYIDWRTNIGMAAYATQQLACGSCPGGISPGDKYTHNAETAAAPWDFGYGDQLKNLAEILKQTGPGGYEEGKFNNLRQATRILRVFLFQRLTDLYGAIPYSNALQATNAGGAFFPTYDKQSVIYADLFKELDEATAALTAADALDGFAKGDIIYKGDIDKWKKWGYSLMLRMAMRVSNVDPAMANTYVAKAVAGGVFASNADNTIVPMAITPSLWTNQNGISRAFIPGDGGQPSYLSKRLIDFLKGTDPGTVADDDPRLMIISGGIGIWTATSWTPTNVDPLAQKGPPNGLDATQLDAYEGKPVSGSTQLATEYSRINPLMMQADEPFMLMNYGEVKLLLAEAAERGIGGLTAGNAAAHYNEGVKASMQMYTLYDATLDVSDAEVAAYLAQYPYAGTQTEKLEMIGEQLWVNHFLNWYEAWSDYRRTGYPNLVPVNYPGNETGGVIPTRLRYPGGEVASNPNWAAGATQPDLYNTKVWWDGGTE
jgi:hypothetical protein